MFCIKICCRFSGGRISKLEIEVIMGTKISLTVSLHLQFNMILVFGVLLALTPVDRAKAAPWLRDENDLAGPAPCPSQCSCPPGQGGSQCPTCTSPQSSGAGSQPPGALAVGVGMPCDWISEERINLRLEDEPLGCQPARGLPVSFHLSYRQRGAIHEEPTISGLGTNWGYSFRSLIHVASSGQPGLHRGGLGV